MLYTKDIFEKGIELAKKTNFIPRDNFPDSGIVFQNANQKPIKKIAVGIDIGPFEIFWAKQQGCDLIIAHHPKGASLCGVGQEVLNQIDNLSFYGVPAEKIKTEIELGSESEHRNVMGDNISREALMAEDLGIDLLVLHTPMDIFGVKEMQTIIEKNNCLTIGDCICALKSLKEFTLAAAYGQKIFVANGSEDEKIGRIAFTEFLGGEEASAKVFKHMKEAGVDTILVPHLSEEFFQAANEAGLKIIYCGHMASDSVGINVFLDSLLKENEELEIVPMGGLLRNKKKK